MKLDRAIWVVFSWFAAAAMAVIAAGLVCLVVYHLAVWGMALTLIVSFTLRRIIKNRADAQELGVKKGDNVRVESRRGEIVLPVEIDGRGKPPRGTLFVPFFDETKLINLVTLDAMDNISKEPDYKKCAVRIERV